MKINYNIIILGFFFLFSIYIFYGILVSPGIILGADWSLPLTSEQYYNGLLTKRYIWNYFGNALGNRAPSSSDLLFFIILGGPSMLGISGEIISKFIGIFLFTLGGFSAFLLSKFFVKEEIPSFLAGLFYMSSPLFFNYICMGWIYILLSYALLPLVLIVFDISIRRKNFKYTILAGLLFSVASIQLQTLLLYPLILFLYIPFIFGKSLRALMSLMIIILICFLIHSFWIIPLLLFPPEAPPFYYFKVEWVASRLNFINLFRIWGSTFNYQFEVSFPHQLLIVTFIVPLLAFVAPLIKPKNRYVLFFAFLPLLPMMIFIGRKYIAYIPFSYAFRDVTRYMVLSALSYSVLLGYVITSLFNKLNKQHFEMFKVNPKYRLNVSTTFLVLVVILILANSSPTWTGQIYANQSQEYDVRLRTLPFPKEYYDVEEWLSQKDGNFKVLWLPTGDFLDYTNLENFHGPFRGTVDIWSTFSSRPGGFFFSYEYASPSTIFAKFVIHSIINNKTKNLGKILGTMNIKYIIVRMNTEVWGIDATQILANLRDQSDLREIQRLGSIIIFENIMVEPLISVNKSSHVVVGDRSLLLLLANLTDLPFNNYLLFFANQLDSNEVRSIITKSDGIILQNDEREDLAFSLMPNSYKIDPSSYAEEYNIQKGWSDYFRWYWQYDWKYTASIESLAFTKSSTSITMPFRSIQESTHEVWVKAYKGHKNGVIDIYIDGSQIGRIENYNDHEKGFTWFYVNTISLSPNKHMLTLKSTGENVVSRVIIAPKKMIKKYFLEADELIQSYVVTNIKSLNTNGLAMLTIPADSKKTEITYQKIDSTKYVVHVNAVNPFFLVFSESYNKNWIAYVDGKQIPNEQHFIANSYANSWYINQTGSYDVTLEFQPQKFVYVGFTISMTTFIICILYISKDKIKIIYHDILRKTKPPN